MKDETDWAGRIKSYRQRNGLTQQALADDLKVDRLTVVRWEKGRERPALRYRQKILAWTPSVEEGVVRGLIDFVDNLDGFATLLDADFRVLRTSLRHQKLMGYDAAEVYGTPSQRYWSAEMSRIINHVGGLKGYRRNGIHRMDLALVRQPGESGFVIRKPVLTIGRTTAIGDPRNPICHLTTLRVMEAPADEQVPAPVVIGLDGRIEMVN